MCSLCTNMSVNLDNTIQESQFESFFENSIKNPIELIHAYYNILLKNSSLHKQLIGDYLLLLIPKYIYLYLLQIFDDIVCYIMIIYITYTLLVDLNFADYLFDILLQCELKSMNYFFFFGIFSFLQIINKILKKKK